MPIMFIQQQSFKNTLARKISVNELFQGWTSSIHLKSCECDLFRRSTSSVESNEEPLFADTIPAFGWYDWENAITPHCPSGLLSLARLQSTPFSQWWARVNELSRYRAWKLSFRNHYWFLWITLKLAINISSSLPVSHWALLYDNYIP